MKDSSEADTSGQDSIHIDADTPCGAAESLRIVTGARLHFGLLDTVPPFGGVGVMIDEPKTEVVIQSASRFGCRDDQLARFESIARRIAQQRGDDFLPRCEIDIVKRSPLHCGLGSGTQLACAVAEGITRIIGLTASSSDIACQFARRGERSAIGSHGYFQGGLICEDRRETDPMNRVLTRVELPSQWRVAIFRPQLRSVAVSGEAEAKKFAKLRSASTNERHCLQSIIDDQIVPAVKRKDFSQFADAVHRYNRLSGQLFAEVQGGPYNGPGVTKLVQSLVDQGARGVGQSSWGPGVFAWFQSASDWHAFNAQLPKGLTATMVTRARNQGRLLKMDRKITARQR